MMSSVSKNRNSTYQAVKLTWIFICRSLLISNTYLQINYVNKNIYKIPFINARALIFFIRGIDNQIQSETLLYK